MRPAAPCGEIFRKGITMAKNKKDKLVMTPEQKKAFAPVLVGAILYALVCGCNTALSSSYVLFASKFDVTTSTVVIGNSCMTAMLFLCSQFSGKFMVKRGARLSGLIALLGVAVGFIIMALAPNVYVVWIGFICLGLNGSFGQTNVTAAIVRSWIAPKYQGKYLGMMTAFASIGIAIWPLLGGVLFTQLDLSVAFYVLVPCFLIPGIIGLLLIKETPESCGVTQLGLEPAAEPAPATATTPAVEASRDASAEAPEKKAFNMFREPAFWLCAIAMFLTVILTSQLTLMSTALQMTGMSAATASSIVSITSLASFFVNLASGSIYDKIGMKGLTIYSYGMVAVCSLALWFFFTTGSVVWMVIFVITNALCRPYMNIHVFASNAIFKENATLVQPRMYSFLNLGSIVLTPLIQSLADMWGGYTNMCWVWIAFSFIIIFIWLAAVKMGEKSETAGAKSA